MITPAVTADGGWLVRGKMISHLSSLIAAAVTASSFYGDGGRLFAFVIETTRPNQRSVDLKPTGGKMARIQRNRPARWWSWKIFRTRDGTVDGGYDRTSI